MGVYHEGEKRRYHNGDFKFSIRASVVRRLLTAKINDRRKLVAQALPKRSCSLQKDIFTLERSYNDFALKRSVHC
jgi:hypothetical protein